MLLPGDRREPRRAAGHVAAVRYSAADAATEANPVAPVQYMDLEAKAHRPKQTRRKPYAPPGMQRAFPVALTQIIMTMAAAPTTARMTVVFDDRCERKTCR